MKMIKSLALMGIGVAGVLAYQKYSKPLMNQMKKTCKVIDEELMDELDEMM